MVKDSTIRSILVIGAGPIVIGQACEFDYSGSQACKALKEEGYRIILLNSNPATIMTDKEMADSVYIEPMTVDIIEKIIQKEKPDAILPTVGGQTALNLALNLHEQGLLEKYNVRLIGANIESIKLAEDRQLFKQVVAGLGLHSAKSKIVNSSEECKAALEAIGLPIVIRPSFTLGGTGGGVAFTEEEYYKIANDGLNKSPIHQILVEESLLGWKEYEMEVVRDKNSNSIIICSIENIDPMGVHTGDSVTVAPAMTLTDKEYQAMRDASINILKAIGLETGGSNVQFAINPKNGRMIVIEMNPRVSRSSALASKATGFPIAKVSAKLAVGYTLDELTNQITGSTPCSFEPTLDYVVTKIPKFTFEKFPDSSPLLTTSMKSIGEVMAIGRNFSESLQKALCSLESGLNGLNEIVDLKQANAKDVIIKGLKEFNHNRLRYIADALRFGFSINEIIQLTQFDLWFVEQIQLIVNLENQLKLKGLPTQYEGLLQLKQHGFSDSRIAELTKQSIQAIQQQREQFGVKPVFKNIDTCAAEFQTRTAYLYSSYENKHVGRVGKSATVYQNESVANPVRKVVILGSGPNRIGQGIEFDYSCCHAAYALKKNGIESIMINCNPETVSTDFETSNKLYFEPLIEEYVLSILEHESQQGELLGVIIQFGGQTPLKLAKAIEEAGFTILSSKYDLIDLVETRERFSELVTTTNLLQPNNGFADSLEKALTVTQAIGYPVIIRPSFVLGGRAMEVIYSDEQLTVYFNKHKHFFTSPEHIAMIDKYLNQAIEIDIDAIYDGQEVYIAGVMEHIEEAGVHSGDSACSLPVYNLPKEVVDSIELRAKQLIQKLDFKGFINIQMALIKKGELDYDYYILEANPRASRTVPFIAKVLGYPIVQLATEIMLGKRLSDYQNLPNYRNLAYYAVKAPVFPFTRFPNSDPILGPEMKSTGEVMGIDSTFIEAFHKSQRGVGIELPEKGGIFFSVKDLDKPIVAEILALLEPTQRFEFYATGGTHQYLTNKGFNVKKLNKIHEGGENIIHLLMDKRVSMVVNTTDTPLSVKDSSYIRFFAMERKLTYYTNISTAMAVAKSLVYSNKKDMNIKDLQSFYKTQKDSE